MERKCPTFDTLGRKTLRVLVNAVLEIIPISYIVWLNVFSFQAPKVKVSIKNRKAFAVIYWDMWL